MPADSPNNNGGVINKSLIRIPRNAVSAIGRNTLFEPLAIGLGLTIAYCKKLQSRPCIEGAWIGIWIPKHLDKPGFDQIIK